jgi:hypothetical protein
MGLSDLPLWAENRHAVRAAMKEQGGILAATP